MYPLGLLLLFFFNFELIRGEVRSVYSDEDGKIHEGAEGGASGSSRDKLMINFRRIFGRQCDLDIFPGICVVKQVTPDKENQFATVLVDFIDTASHNISYDIKYMIFLAEPSVEYVTKNNIVEGAEFSCKKKVSKSGPCEPVHITFDLIDDPTLIEQEASDPSHPPADQDEL
ncbi:hypothetical protein GL50803_004571 [Giardia duodenalis]|uniref:Uncharacterized protein n=1 Tax=Giardia intestinalis (strain ATCC 50803 / WB clone C6) TaxID=184922 RepID=A8BHD9_GIAIC|nr:hypothetical protein GL50803_004571 [Giardia intestinalis]KAE8301659.1 hypothetical protein GL50803_004571 [Giardia intestinalis]|eukprot:XP_001707088.1 Hypothetical protein GL50803_4571 [Giardia lamblia ATCC 50803]